MTKPTLLITRRMTPAVEARASRDYEVRLNEPDAPFSPETLLERAEGCDALFIAGNRITAEIAERLPGRVRAIATLSVGLDHIDLDACRRFNRIVTNTPDVLTAATADIALLLMLGACRRAGEGEALIRAAAWKGFSPTEMLGIDLTGKRLGIVGMGRIGQAVAHRARAFHMPIHYHNRRRLDPADEQGAVFHADLDEMLPQVEVLSLNCPSTPETRHLLDARRIALLPRGAVVVNTARGEVVEDEALIAALGSGHLFAAGLDVYQGEPNLNPAYPSLPNTFLLPHLGSATVETRTAMGMRCLDNLDAVFAGREPPDRVA